jgi:hypothetical protein
VGFGNENQTCGLYCGGTSPCLDGPFCDPDLACVNNVCVRTKAAGATCGLGDPVPCAAELHCTAHPVDAQSVGTCEPRVTGGACFANTDCPGSDFCWQGVCTARRSQGQACSDAPTGCAPWTWCDRPTGTCVPGGRPGLPCLLTADARYVYCQVGACSPESVCVPYANPGESCDWNACAMGGSCDVATLTCVACAP